MAKKIMAVVLGFILAPAFITAQNSVGTSIVGTVCLVRVYHTNFAFPSQGGRIVKIGDEMFFWKSYLPECANVLPANTPVMVTTYSGVEKDPYNLNGEHGAQLVGNPCSIRVYHTNFSYPPEGGKIVKVGNQMFFVRTYIPGCERAGEGAEIVSGGNPRTYVQPTPVTTTTTSSYQLGNQNPTSVEAAARPNCY